MLTSSKGTFVAAGKYTVLIGNVSANLQETILKDQARPPPPARSPCASLARPQRLAPSTSTSFLQARNLSPLRPSSQISFGRNTGYINIPNGTYTIVMVPTGTVPTSTTVATYTCPQVTYIDGRRYYRPHRSATGYNARPAGHHRTDFTSPPPPSFEDCSKSCVPYFHEFALVSVSLFTNHYNIAGLQSLHYRRTSKDI